MYRYCQFIIFNYDGDSSSEHSINSNISNASRQSWITSISVNITNKKTQPDGKAHGIVDINIGSTTDTYVDTNVNVNIDSKADSRI